MPQLWKLLLQNPIRFFKFLHAFIAQLSLIALEKLLLPGWPHVQSFRLRLHRAYWASSSYYFPELIHRLPVTNCPSTRARRVGSDWTGYIIPGTKDIGGSKSDDAIAAPCVIVYAHGGGYARGEARMYLNYMERWVSEARKTGIDLMFVSVEYPLTHEASHPAQLNAFLKAYEYVLQNTSPEHIIFMGDSAGGGLCVLSCLEAKRRGLPQPAGAVLVSPWIDMSLESFQGGNALVQTDYVVGANSAVPEMAAAWLNGIPGTSPQVNPLFCSPTDFKNLCPQLILVGGGEFALQEAKSLATMCRNAGVRHHLEVEWGQMHLYALGSRWVSREVRLKTDRLIYWWIMDCLSK
ncbi:alpha/beta-hydrolase [Aspergillus ambiguus]|uniref:alpha/beta-hydrolase n=1 Tax=Aspergillus ambiguus TaxID=176160 RepID=UPI003CCD62C7